MCLRITFRERPKHPARFCNRYLSSAILAPDAGPLGNQVAFSAAIDSLDAISLIEAYEGRTPHVTNVSANINMRRGEQLAFLRSVKAPKRVRAGQRVRLRVKMQRVRGGNLTRSYRVRIPQPQAGQAHAQARSASSSLRPTTPCSSCCSATSSTRTGPSHGPSASSPT